MIQRTMKKRRQINGPQKTRSACTGHSYEGEEQSSVEFVRQKFLPWIFMSNVSKSMMVGPIIVSFSLSFVLSFSPLVITVCHLPGKIFSVTLLIQVLRGMNKTNIFLWASLVSFLLNDLLAKLLRFISVFILYTFSMKSFPLPSEHTQFSVLCSSQCELHNDAPCHGSVSEAELQCLQYNTSPVTVRSISLPKLPVGAVSCQQSSWKKEELRGTRLTLNWIAYGAEKNKEAILTFTKLNG